MELEVPSSTSRLKNHNKETTCALGFHSYGLGVQENFNQIKKSRKVPGDIYVTIKTHILLYIQFYILRENAT